MKHKPNLFEIFRTDTSSESSAIAHLTIALTPKDINWNYVDGTKRAMYAHKGIHDLTTLTSCLKSKAETDGYKYNKELIEAVAPLAFGRETSVITPEKQLFRYGKDREAAFRVPFFFIENRVIKAYALQTRKHDRWTKHQVSGYATILKHFLLDDQFFDQPTDIEFVDASCVEGTKTRSPVRYCLADLNLWSSEELEGHLQVISKALDFIELQEIVKKVRRPLRDAEMPLFGE